MQNENQESVKNTVPLFYDKPLQDYTNYEDYTDYEEVLASLEIDTNG